MPALLLIMKKNAPVADSPGKWLAGEVVQVYEADYELQSGEVPERDVFVNFTVTDRTVEEMKRYLDTYNRDIQMSVFQGPNPEGLRAIHVRNLNCNASGTIGAWTEEDANAIITEWNGRYPECGLITLGFPFPHTWDCQGTFATGQAQEFEEVVLENGKNILDNRKIWYISPAGMQNIINAGGSQSGTSSQLSNILFDRRET